jgi:hypothetical protein
MTLKMKISFDEILPPDVLLYAGTRNSSNFSILGDVLDQNVLFPHLTLKMTVKVICLRSKYQKRVMSDMVKILSYRTSLKSDIWFGL